MRAAVAPRPVARAARRGFAALAGAAKLVLAVVFVLPVLWMFLSSLRPVTEIFQYVYPLSLHTLVPVHISVASYRHLFADEPFARYLGNSFFMAATVTVLDLAASSLAAYGFARFRFPGRDALFFLVLATMIIPFEALLVPLYLIVRDLGWVNSYLGLILPMVPRALSIFLLRQFFLGLPVELEEAAKIDGCQFWRIYWHILLPLSRSILLSVALLTFQEMWGSFTWPLVVTNSPDLRVVQVAIATFGQAGVTEWDKVFAALSLAAVVPVGLFVVFQRYYARGIATTGLRG